MKQAYPVILTPDPVGYFVTVPDINRNTQGSDIADAISMARDMIGLWGIVEQDAGRAVPAASSKLPAHKEDEIVTFVDVDFEEYRLKNDMVYERTNVTIPRGLKRKAAANGINLSQVLQEGLRDRLGI